MTDFDTRLRERLERLEAAIPDPRQYSTPSTSEPREASASAGRRRRRRVIVLLAAAALFVGASAATAQRLLYPDLPEPALEAAVSRVFAAGDGCLSAKEARGAIQDQLDEMGYDDWTIESRSGAESARCVSSFLVPHHAVVLIRGIGPDTAEAMEAVADELLRQCLGRADAMQLVSSALSSAGETDFVVRADPWGPQGAPIDKIDAYRDHLAAGCYVYVGAPTREDDGTMIHDLWGPWP